MSIFARMFAIELISDQILKENPWFMDMLLAWRPAGDALHRDMTEAYTLVSSGQLKDEDPKRLRLAIRNGSFSLYRGGQSVAKIKFGSRGRLEAGIHKKYVHGEKSSGKTYVTLTSAGLLDPETSMFRAYGGPAELHGWIANANKYVGKREAVRRLDRRPQLRHD
jgi:hypothetical protein